MQLDFYADYHTHTWFSHGRGTIEGNVLEAIRKKLKAVAITDHSFASPFIGLNPTKVYRMRRIVDDLNRRYQRDITVLLGVEANIVNSRGQIDVPRNMFSPFDLLAVGLHRMVFVSPVWDGARMNAVNNLRWLTEGIGRLARQINTQALVRAMERYPVDIVTHPGFCYPVDLPPLAAAAENTGTLLEINNSHAMPDGPDLHALVPGGVRFVAGSDAHHPRRVGCLQRAAEIIAGAGLPIERIVNAVGNPAWRFKSHESGGSP